MAVNELSIPRTGTAIDERSQVWHPRRRIKWGTVARHAVLIFFCLVVLLPLAWVILLSLKSLQDGVQRWIIPKHWASPLYANYQWVIKFRPDVWVAFRNSVLVTSLTVVTSTIIAVLAGYALVHLRTPFRGVIVAILVGSLFFPTRVTAIIGIYNIQDRLGFINRTWTLMFPYTSLSVALSVFIMRGVFESVPKDIVDSFRIDGASSFRGLIGIVVPLVRNGVVVVVIVNFVAAWGEFLLALTLMNDASKRTLPVYIASNVGGISAMQWPQVGALYIIAIAPGLFFFGIAQRWYMKGLQEGALKT
jgi:multiple sugar transport system permease protein